MAADSRDEQNLQTQETSYGNDFDQRRKNRMAGILFLGGVTGISMSAGFGYALSLAKKKDPTMFSQGLVGSQTLPESGGALALRALGRGTAYAFTGFGLLCYGVWKLMGVHNMDEFTAKMQSVMPTIPKSENPGKSDFKSIREIFEYIISEDEKKKADR